VAQFRQRRLQSPKLKQRQASNKTFRPRPNCTRPIWFEKAVRFSGKTAPFVMAAMRAVERPDRI
jgi:hypothetical protein